MIEPVQRMERGLRLVVVGMLVNVALAVVKMAAGVFGHSHALVADGVESLSDLFSSAIVWRGLRVSSMPADDDHPYGHGKAEPIATAMVSVLLLLAALWIAVQAVREIVTPHSAPRPFTLAVLLVVVVVKEGLFRKLIGVGTQMDSSAVRSDAWHHRSDAITSLAAGVGIAVALVGGPGYEAADDYAALVAAGVIAWNGRWLLRGALRELMDEAPAVEVVQRIRAEAGAVTGVRRIEKCLVRKVGPRHFVEMHVEVDEHLTVRAAHDIAHAVKDRVRTAVNEVADVLVHIEPAGPGEITGAPRIRRGS